MKFGITSEFDCNYLDDHMERLLVCVEPSHKLEETYSYLSTVGFRRSGEQVYRPHCVSCNQCQSVRVIVDEFTASKSQKRVRARNKHLDVRINNDIQGNYYALFERYISGMHRDGSMYPTSMEQFTGFVACEWTQPLFLEAWDEDNLVAVAVTDKLDGAYSALYTFFDPELSHLSLGTYMVMQQIALCQQHHKTYLYLGYQIDACRKMNYKTKFKPFERFFDEKWHLYVK